MGKKVSVIIPCYNAAKWLPRCFMSLVHQTIGIASLELIFVNDASTDDGATWTMLTEMETVYPKSVAIIDLQVNMRQGGARNAGLSYATGEYIAFVDADDWVKPDFLEKVYKKAVETDADIVQFGFDYYFESIGATKESTQLTDEIINIKTAKERKKLLLSEKITYGCWNKLYKRELVARAGVAYAEHVIYEEPLFVYPLLFEADKFTIMSDSFYIYRQNAAGTMRNDMKAKTTLLDHARVQLMVWQFMKQKPYFDEYYEEIKLYFLHTYLYEILDFAKARGITLDYCMYKPLMRTALAEAGDITKTPYAGILVKQMPLYEAIARGMDEADYRNYVDKL